MAIPSVMQGLIETDDGKVFELESSRGSAWLESIGSFRFEPSGDSKPYTVRKESGIYWYGCRKIAGKVRKKYIGKSLEVTVAKLEEIAEALEIPPLPRANKVAEVTQKVAEGVTEVAQDRLTVLESQVANLQKAVEALQEALPGKLGAGDSLELPEVDNEVAKELQNELGNLEYDHALTTPEEALANAAIFGFTPEEALADAHFQISMLQANCDELEDKYEATKRDKKELDDEIVQLRQQLAENEAVKGATTGHLYQEIEALKERNRLLLIKSREERQKLEEDLATLKYRDESQSRRLQEKQSRVDELEVQAEELRSQLQTEKTRGEELWEELGDTEEALAEVRAENSELKKTCDDLRSQVETQRIDQNEEIKAELANLAQLKKWAKEHADELHREENSMKLEKVRWQRELGDARAELADAKATILTQGNKIRELERGYSFKPNPAESRLRLEIGELREQLSDLKQKSATAREFSDAADVLNQLKTKRKKSSVTLADVESILEILEES